MSCIWPCTDKIIWFNLKLLKLFKFWTKRQAVLQLSNFPGSRVNLCAMKGRPRHIFLCTVCSNLAYLTNSSAKWLLFFLQHIQAFVECTRLYFSCLQCYFGKTNYSVLKSFYFKFWSFSAPDFDFFFQIF